MITRVAVSAGLDGKPIMTKEHPYAELLRAIADGKELQIWHKVDSIHGGGWEDIGLTDIFTVIKRGFPFNWRTKPRPKSDIITKMFVEAYPKLENAWNRPNLELTFDGETQKLKSVRILDAT